MGGDAEEKGKGSPWWGNREKGVRSKAGWAGFGCQAGLPGSRPIRGREPEKKQESRKVNGGWRPATG